MALAFSANQRYLRVGVVHVIERLDWHQGRLHLGNFLYQFFAGTMVIASGHSIGREGPAVHLGSAAASIMGKCHAATQQQSAHFGGVWSGGGHLGHL